jgi:hypothetical protein
MGRIDLCEALASRGESAPLSSLHERKHIRSLFAETAARYAEQAVLFAVVIKTRGVIIVFCTEASMIAAERNSVQVSGNTINCWKVRSDVVCIEAQSPSRFNSTRSRADFQPLQPGEFDSLVVTMPGSTPMSPGRRGYARGDEGRPKTSDRPVGCGPADAQCGTRRGDSEFCQQRRHRSVGGGYSPEHSANIQADIVKVIRCEEFLMGLKRVL